MSARDLKRELLERGVDTSLFLEKGGLIEALVGPLRRAGPDGGAEGDAAHAGGDGAAGAGGGSASRPSRAQTRRCWTASFARPSRRSRRAAWTRRSRWGVPSTTASGVDEAQPLGVPKYYVAADTATGRVRVVHEAMPTGGAGPGDVDEETGYKAVDCRLVGRNGAVFA